MPVQNGVMIEFFHWYTPSDGSHRNDALARATGLAAAGFTGIRLPPAYKGVGGGFDVGCGVYDMYDLGESGQSGSAEHLGDKAAPSWASSGACGSSPWRAAPRPAARRGRDWPGTRSDSRSRSPTCSSRPRIDSASRSRRPRSSADSVRDMLAALRARALNTTADLI